MVAKIKIVFKDQHRCQSLVPGLTQHRQMTHETAACAQRRKAAGLVGLAGFKNRHLGCIQTQADALKLGLHFLAAVSPRAQVDDDHLRKKGVDVALHGQQQCLV